MQLNMDFFKDPFVYGDNLNFSATGTTIHGDNLSFDAITQSELEKSMAIDFGSDDIEPLASTHQLSEKSRLKYQAAYERFESWCAERQIETVDETIMLEYFKEKSTEFRSSTLWCMYWMIRATLNAQYNVNISTYTTLVSYLKEIAKSEKVKLVKSRIFTKEEITRFLLQADDKKFLFMKVALIIGICGTCTRSEMVNLTVQNVKDEEYFFDVSVVQIRSKETRNFLVTPGNVSGVDLVKIVRKYIELRPEVAPHQRFFTQYLNGKCTKQPVGVNTLGAVPRKIAKYLKLPDAEEFTGHCFKRSPPTLVADSIADLMMINKKYGKF